MPVDPAAPSPCDGVEDKIVDFIRRELLGSDTAIEHDTDLLGDGMLDSLGVLRLATFVDTDYQLGMQPADFVIENFMTVSALAAYIRRARPVSEG